MAKKLSKVLRGKSASSLSGRSERMTPEEIKAAKDMGFAVAKKGGRLVAAMKGDQIVSMMYDD